MSVARSALDAGVVTIVGLGLIGGSIARGLRATGFAGELRGAVETEADAARALALGLVDSAGVDPAQAVANADLVILAIPVGAIGSLLANLRRALPARAVITDTGSTKLGVIRDARAGLGEDIGRFVPGHPIAGTEGSGLEAGFAELYRHRRVILTPTPETDPDALHRVEQLWSVLGARVSEMDAAHHDEVLAATSHVPHVLAFALVDTLARMAERTEIFEYAAGGFADFTRIASSDPALWGGIVGANRDAILPVLDRYMGKLAHLRQAIEQGDQTCLIDCFSRAKQARDRFTEDQDKP